MDDCLLCTRHVPDADGDCTGACHHPDATVGRLCLACAQDCLTAIDTIHASWQELEADPAAAAGTTGSGSERPLPGGTDRLDYIVEAPAVISAWVRAVHEDHCTHETPIPWPGNNMASMCAWLRRHFDHHVSQYEAVEELWSELRDLAARGRRLTGTDEPGQVVRCPSPWGDAVCGRRLRVDIRSEQHVLCRRCGTDWTPARLLAVAMTGDLGDVLADAEAVREVLGVPERTLRRWAAEGKVRRVHGRYSVADVKTNLNISA